MRYRIKNWHDYQHYKDRCPPWIKLHSSLLTSEVWVMGNDATRCLMIASMVLASRNSDNDGSFNGDPEYAKRFAYLNTKPDFKPLLDNGFIEVVQDASTPLAKCDTEKSREETEESREDIYSPSKIILDYLNEKAQSKFRPVPANIKLIESRLKEGATVEEMKSVVDVMVGKWKDDEKMREYLRPSTLFNATKYSQYFGLAAPKQKTRTVSL